MLRHGNLAMNHSPAWPMAFVEVLRQTRSRAGQEAHALSADQYGQCETNLIEETFQSELPNASVVTDVINREIE